MPVIGIEQVPREIVRPSVLGDVGYAKGRSVAKLEDALLAFFLGKSGNLGQVPTVPTPQRPGTLTFPSGATTPTSPLELAQIQQLGGVPSRTGQMTPLAPGGVTYQQPTRLGILPDLSRQKTQSDIDLQQRQADYYKTLTGLITPQTPTPSPVPPPTPPLPPASPVLGALWKRAQGGDIKALDAIRHLAIEKDDPEAIVLLQNLGEL